MTEPGKQEREPEVSADFIQRVQELGGSSDYLQALRNSDTPARSRMARVVVNALTTAGAGALLLSLYYVGIKILQAFGVDGLLVAGVILTVALSLVLIIVGGFRYITSGGDAGNVAAAKNTLIYGFLGLVLVAIVQFVVIPVIRLVVD
jgi:hypothetical protein